MSGTVGELGSLDMAESHSSSFKSVIVDMDGTLIDSAPDIRGYLQQAAIHILGREVDFGEVAVDRLRT